MPNGGGLICDEYSGGPDPIAFALHLGGAGAIGGLGNYPAFGRYNGSSWGGAISPDPVSVGVWTHIAGVATATGMSIYVNGVRKATSSDTLVAHSVTQLRLSSRWDNTGEPAPDAYYNDMRITKAARYTGATFDLPTDYYPDSPC